MDFFDVVRTQRAMRRLRPDPVSDADLWKILDAAIRAPSGGNRQGWNFIVIRDAETKRKIAAWYLDGWEQVYGAARDVMLASADPSQARTYRSADYLARHLADVPVIIIATLRRDGQRLHALAGASIYPAVQNLMLAARALGLGATLTTLHRAHEQEVKELLGIPEDVETRALIPVGYPRGKFGEAPRMPAEKVVYWERWDATRTRPGVDSA
jgi:nitroreductase